MDIKIIFKDDNIVCNVIRNIDKFEITQMLGKTYLIVYKNKQKGYFRMSEIIGVYPIGF